MTVQKAQDSASILAILFRPEKGLEPSAKIYHEMRVVISNPSLDMVRSILHESLEVRKEDLRILSRMHDERRSVA